MYLDQQLNDTVKKILETIALVDVEVAVKSCRGYRAAAEVGSSSPWDGKVLYGTSGDVEVVVDQDAMSVYCLDKELHNCAVGRYVAVVPTGGELARFVDDEFEVQEL